MLAAAITERRANTLTKTGRRGVEQDFPSDRSPRSLPGSPALAQPAHVHAYNAYAASPALPIRRHLARASSVQIPPRGPDSVGSPRGDSRNVQGGEYRTEWLDGGRTALPVRCEERNGGLLQEWGWRIRPVAPAYRFNAPQRLFCTDPTHAKRAATHGCDLSEQDNARSSFGSCTAVAHPRIRRPVLTDARTTEGNG